VRGGTSIGLAALALVAALASGCAGRSGPPQTIAGTPAQPGYDELFDEPQETEVEDPLEPLNRPVFALNRGMDRFLIDPISRAYSFAVPGVARRAIRRVFVNLNSPSVLVNDLLQLSPKRASVIGARFVINTTVGLAGLWDAAERFGLRGHHNDFGVTLAKYGVGSGPYLVLPVLGPTTARDAFGELVDLAMLPQTWFFGPTTWVFAAYQGSDGFTLRDVHRGALKALEESSVDFYVAMRFAYLSNRASEIQSAGQRGTRADGGLTVRTRCPRPCPPRDRRSCAPGWRSAPRSRRAGSRRSIPSGAAPARSRSRAGARR
jgi:phospholipid-binding lipoprotein MlaA